MRTRSLPVLRFASFALPLPVSLCSAAVDTLWVHCSATRHLAAHTGHPQPLPLHAAADARSMPYKSGARKYRWMGAQAKGHSLFMGVVHVVEGGWGDMVVVHTDQVSRCM